MMTEYLFDDVNDRGKGVDSIGNKDDFKYNWCWWGSRGKKKGKPSQISQAFIEGFKLEAIYWHTSYEARIEYIDGHLDSIKDTIKTRVDAQHAAEKLLHNWIKKANKLII